MDVPVVLPSAAVTVAVPLAEEVSSPFWPEVLLMVAVDAGETLQWTEFVTVCWLPSFRVATAVYC